jgi:hypothetical protein
MTSAFLLINCDFPFSEDVINELGKIPEIVDVYRLHGMYDIIARVKSDTEEELNDVVKTRIRKIDKVKSTITMIIAEGDKLKDKNKIWKANRDMLVALKDVTVAYINYYCLFTYYVIHIYFGDRDNIQVRWENQWIYAVTSDR